MATDAQQTILKLQNAWLLAYSILINHRTRRFGMSSKDSDKEAIKEFLGFEDYEEFWKAVKEDLHSRVLARD